MVKRLVLSSEIKKLPTLFTQYTGFIVLYFFLKVGKLKEWVRLISISPVKQTYQVNPINTKLNNIKEYKGRQKKDKKADATRKNYLSTLQNNYKDFIIY